LEKLAEDIFASYLITGALDELRVVLGDAAALVMETLMRIYSAYLRKSCNLIPERYGLRLCKSMVYGGYMGENELRNFSF